MVAKLVAARIGTRNDDRSHVGLSMSTKFARIAPYEAACLGQVRPKIVPLWAFSSCSTTLGGLMDPSILKSTSTL